jgi:hypothetical protein
MLLGNVQNRLPGGIKAKIRTQHTVDVFRNYFLQLLYLFIYLFIYLFTVYLTTLSVAQPA